MAERDIEAGPSRKKNVRRDIRFVFLMTALAAAIVSLPLVVGIWLPEIFDSRERVLAETVTSSSYKFRVVQYWNHVDFYTTELHVIRPDGTIDKRLVDDDDGKHWSLPLVIDEQRRIATVTVNGRVQAESWDSPPASGGLKAIPAPPTPSTK